MDETIAAAIMKIASEMPAEWALMQHYITLKLIRTRDQMEQTASDKLGGYSQGLRFLFELPARAECKLEGKTWKRDKLILGEEEFITTPYRATSERVDLDE